MQDKAAAAPLSSFGAICEKASIWSELTKDSTVQGIENIDWGKIQAEADSQIEHYKLAITNAQNEISQLVVSIATAKGKESTRPATETEIDDLVKKATEPFKGKATETECGRVTDRKVRALIRGAYEASVDKMKTDAAAFFEGEPKSLDPKTFMTRCAAVLGATTFCNHLCSELKSAAASFATAGAVTKSSELVDRMNALLAEVAVNQKKQAVCEDARAELTGLEGAITTGSENIKERFLVVRRARNALIDAEDGLADLTDDLEEEETRMKEVEKELEGNTEEEEAAKKSLEAKREKEEELKGKMKSTIASIKVLSNKLVEATEADKSVQELIRVVSALLTKMWLYFDDAALKPMRRHGITLDLDLTPYFFTDIKQLGEAGKLEKAVDGLEAFCTQEALPAFRAVKMLDLTPLCATGDAPSMKSSIYDAINDRIEDVKGLITEAKSWTDPLKGQPTVTTELVHEYVKEGELEGLRAIIGAYQHTEFYQYLQGWKQNGEYLGLIGMLVHHMKSIEKDLKNLNTEVEKLKELIAAAVEAREAAETSLKNAQEAKGATEESKAKLATVIATLQEEKVKADNDLAELRARLEAAEKALEAAKEALQKTYEAGVKGESLLQPLLKESRYHGKAVKDMMTLEKSS